MSISPDCNYRGDAMSITNKLNKIKNAIYGKEVRGAIHDAIKECYDDATVNHDNANMEVKMARGTHNTLNDRLDNVDKIQAQTNAQLSDVVEKIKNEPVFKNGVLELPNDFPKLPFTVHKYNNNYSTSISPYTAFDWSDATQVYISNRIGTGDGLSPSSAISIGRFDYNLKNSVYGDKKKFIVNILNNVLVDKTTMTIDTQGVDILFRSLAPNGFSWCGRFLRPNTNGECETSWVLSDGIYKITQSKTYNILDVMNLKVLDDADMPKAYQRVSSLSECKNMKGSYYQADSSNDIYCNPHLNHLIKDVVLLIPTTIVNLNPSTPNTVIFENIGFPSDSLRVNPSSLNCQLYFFNCKFYRNPNDAIGFNGAYHAYLFNCLASHGSKDGFNYHTTNPNSLAVEVNCHSFNNGVLKLNNGNQTTHSNNGSTAHDGMSVLRVGCTYWNCEGPIVADVDGCYSINIGCKAADIIDTNTGVNASFYFSNSRKSYVIDCEGGGKNVEYGVVGDSNTVVSGFKGNKNYKGDIQIID